MKDIRVDAEGEFRCWNCGNKGLLEKRTFRSKALVGVGALLTKKKLKCQTCGEYNDTGNAKPYTGPAARKWRKVWEANEKAKSRAQIEAEARAAQTAADAMASALVEAANSVRQASPSPLEGPPAIEVTGTLDRLAPPAWLPDPRGRHELRYWDGEQWTEHVSNAEVVSQDPV
ncbi:MAG: DUF2510 domain-containing protein [Acidimicrobiales bacterium]